MDTITAMIELLSTKKRCFTCEQILPITDFYECSRNKDGYRGNCKNCVKGANNESYKRQADRAKQAAIRKCSECGNTVNNDKHEFCSHKCKTTAQFKEQVENVKGVEDGLSISGIHGWVQRNFEKSEMCDFCNEKPEPAKDGRSRLHWANKSGKYLRDREDWHVLCVSCHSDYDRSWTKRDRKESGQFV